MNYPVIITADPEDGGYVVECPAIPGCVSEGDTVEEALANIREAIDACLAVLREKGELIPAPHDSMLATVEVGG